jgi:hypothetical protein
MHGSGSSHGLFIVDTATALFKVFVGRVVAPNRKQDAEVVVSEGNDS